jgi:hypothetical protein
MATYEKKKLSEDPTGAGIWLGYSFDGETVHTTGTSANILDELWLYISNIDTSPKPCSIDINETTTVTVFVPGSSGMFLVLPGILVSGTGTVGTSLLVKDNSGSGSMTVYGYVNRITP